MLDLFKTPKLYFNRLVLLCVSPFYIPYFKIKAVGLENVPKKGPFLMVANHSHLLDPFFMGALIRRPIFQMASNEFFRTFLMRRFMWAMGAFPRKKGFTDFKSIKYAIHLVKKGYPLVIYPEGGRNWDGETVPLLKSTSKLVKLLEVPLIAAVFRGNYLAYPRWADRRRKCPITVSFSEPVMFNKKSSEKDIVEYIRKRIYNNDNYTEVEYIQGKNPAQGLPRLLWKCPHCRTIDALFEKDGNHICCTHCRKEWEVNFRCSMREKGQSDWKAIKEYSDSLFKEEEVIPLLNDSGVPLMQKEKIYLKSKRVVLYHQPFYPKLKKVGKGVLYLTNRRLFFIQEKKAAPLSYMMESILGRSTERNNIFQLILENDLARFELPHESCYKWEIMYDSLRRRGGYKQEEEF